MKSIFLSLAAAVIVALGALTSPPPATTAPASPQDPTDGSTYVGADACKKCHFKEHRTWGQMKHAEAWNKLPEKYRDPAQQDEDGRACISCHVTGYGRGDRGGFVDATQSANLLGVQCEACHGPGSQHVEAGKALMAEKRKSFEEGEARFINLKTAACADCHNPHVSHAQYAEGT